MIPYQDIPFKNFAGVFYRNQYYTGYDTKHRPGIRIGPSQNPLNGRVHDPEQSGLTVNPTEEDFESIESYEIRANFLIKKNLNIQAIVPYGIYTTYFKEVYDLSGLKPVTDTTIQVRGMGDPLVFAGYVYQKEGKIRTIIRPWTGFSVPLGKSFQEGESEFLDPSLYPGSGGWSFLGGLSFQAFYKRFGFQLEPSVRVFFGSNNNYRKGDQLNITSSFFYTLNWRNWSLVPRAGYYFEGRSPDEYNGSSEFYASSKIHSALLGMDLKYNWITLTNTFAVPFYQEYSSEHMIQESLWVLGLVVSF